MTPGFDLGFGKGLSRPRVDRFYPAPALALFDRMAVQPSTEWKQAYVSLFAAIGPTILGKLDALYRKDGPTEQASKLNLLGDAYNLTGVASPTWTTKVGFTGNGTSNYLDTGFNPATAVGAKYAQDSACLAVHNRIEAGTSSVGIAGFADASNGTTIRARSAADNAGFRINNVTVASVAGVTDGRGVFAVDRSGGTASALYRNGVEIGTSANASVVLASHGGAFRFLSATATTFSATTIGGGYIGQSLTAPEHLQISNAFAAWDAAIAVL